MSKCTTKPKKGFTINEQLIMKHDVLKNTQRSKESEIKVAQQVIHNHSQINSSQPIKAWKKLLGVLEAELKAIKLDLHTTAVLIQKKHINPTSEAYISATKTAENQRSILSFFPKPLAVENSRRVHFSPGTK